MAFADGNIIIGTSVDVCGLNTGLKKIEKSFGRIGKLASVALGIGAFAKLGKAALDAASDLQEVQNVVDVAFGRGTSKDMTGKIESFAKTCIESFGMSEFAAKQTAGSYMAMGKSMGLTMEEASDMAVSLTALTGDMASFLNISQDYARVGLSAVYTGETETLKRYGIILTEANLQQYLNSKGIDENVKKMDARNKAILRYQYIMETTKYMEGDFAATQNSWANSTRILQETWKQFLIVLGSGLVSVLTPLVDVLGKIVVRLTQFMKTLWQILSNIFGFKLQSLTDQTRDIADNIGGGVDAMEDLGKEADKTNKKLLKQLGTFDELNNLSTQASSSSGGSSGLDLGGLDLGINESPWDPDNPNNPFADIDSLYDLGKWIGDKLSAMMENIDWQSIYNKAWRFGQGLAEFLNGLISTDLFKDLGHTIAAALNTAVRAALAFAWNFDWKQFGQKLADGVNEFFYTFDFDLLAEAINKWVQGLWTALKEFLTNVDWKAVFSGVKEFFTNLDPETIAIILGFIALRKLIKAALLKTLIEGIKDGMAIPSLTSLISGLGEKIGAALVSKSFWISIGTGLKTAFTSAFTWLTTTLPATISQFISSLSGAFSTLFYNLSLGNSLNVSMTGAFGGTATLITGLVTTIGGLVLAVKEFFDMWSQGWSGLKTILEALGIAIAAIGAVILGAPAAIAALIAGIVFGVSQLAIIIHDNWDSIKEWFIGVGDWFKQNVIDPVVNGVKSAWITIKNVVTPILEFFEGLFKRIEQFAEGCWIVIKAIWIVTSEWFKSTVIEPVVNFFKEAWEKIKGFFQKLWEDIKTIWTVVATWFNNTVIQPIINFFSPIVEKIAGFFKRCWDKIKPVWSSVANWFKTTVIDPVVNAWNTAIEKIKGFFTSLWDSITTGVKGAMNGLLGAIETAINWIIDKINGFIEGFNAIVKGAAAITGDSWSGVDLIQKVSIPRLAQGGVIPPNNPFMAMLGDNKKEQEIVSPLSTMKQALLEALQEAGGSGNSGDIVVQIDGREVFRAVQRENKNFIKRTGSSAFSY